MSTVSAAMAAATAHHRRGELSEVESICSQIVAADPGHVPAWELLGLVAQQRGHHAEAVRALSRAVELSPRVETWNNLGCAHRSAGKLDQAENCFRLALEARPDSCEVLLNFGSVLHERKDYTAAAICFDRAIALDPASCDAYCGLGAVQHSRELYDDAISQFHRALAIEPNSAEVLARLGACLTRVGRHDEAIDYLRHALAIDPNSHVAHDRLGQCQQVQGLMDEAIASFSRAIDLQPAMADYHYHRATARLMAGDFDNGWAEYEWRLQTVNASPIYSQRRWKGEPLSGQRIVIYAEWGLGDTLQFVRFVPLVEALGGDVTLKIQPGLIPLLRESGFEQLAPGGALDDREYQWQVPLLSLPSVFRTTIDTIPSGGPYLEARRELVDRWRDRLSCRRGPKVGIHWHGRPAWAADPRSIALAEFQPLVQIAGVTLISLQKGDPGGQLRQFDDQSAIVSFGDELDSSGGAFMDTAAIMKNLDLVITCDTSIAHLAGGLGVPVWVALPRASEWRWLRDREDSPWYPTMRLFRTTRHGGWGDVFRRMSAELAKIAATASVRSE